MTLPRALPRGIRHDPNLPGVDREEQRGLGAEPAGAPLEPVPTAEPAVAQQHLDAVRARPQQRSDVVRGHLQALAVRREAGDEFVIADADAVEEHLDEAVRRDRQGRRLWGGSHREVRAELVGRPIPGSRDLARVPFDEGTLTGTLTKDTRWPEGDWRNTYFVPENLSASVDRAEALRPLVPPGMTMPELALRWILEEPTVSTIIPGMRKVKHVEANIAASDGKRLDPGFVKQLKGHRWDRTPTEWSQ